MSVRVEDRDRGLRLILLDRPTKLNAIDMSVVTGITGAIETADGAAVVLGSTSPASFSSGADLGLPDAERAAVSEALYRLYAAMRSAPQVIIAAASGHAVGGGAQLLVASDIRIAAPDVSIRFMGPGHGLAVGAWGLPSLVGRGRAMDLCLSMREVGADEAVGMGLVDRVEADPLRAAVEYGEHLVGLEPGAVAAVKRIVEAGPPGEALRLEQEHNSTWDGAVPGPRES